MDPLPYGPVVVRGDDGAFRIGYYDDDTWIEELDDGEDPDGGDRAIVYYSEPPFLFDDTSHFVPPSALAAVDTDALLRRRELLADQLITATEIHRTAKRRGRGKSDDRYALLLEWSLLNSVLADRMLDAQARVGSIEGKRVFISHSSTDKPLAIAISVDLSSEGHLPWLDQWEIRAGESIPVKIGEGLEQCDFVLVLMSKIAVGSGWVEAEWTTKYWDEVTSRRVQVVPVLLEDCTIPTLLKTKKYADFRTDYHSGISEVLKAIR